MNAIGIDIGGTQIKAVVTDAHGQVLRREMQPTEDDGSKAMSFAQRVRELVAELGPDLPVGIAAPGIVIPNLSEVSWLPERLRGIVGLDWTKWLGRERKIPVLNDAHAAAAGELWVGAALKFSNAIVLTLGTGVGGALIMDRKVVKGSGGRAGHLGHAGIDWHSSMSSIVGMPGALECFVGNYNVRERTGGQFSTTHALIDAYRVGDADARRYWLESVRALAYALASFANIFNPEAFIIGGGIAEAGDALFKPLGEELAKIEWRPFPRGVPVIPATLGEWAGAIGAAREALNWFPEAKKVEGLFHQISKLASSRMTAQMELDSIKTLIAQNAPLNEKDNEGWTAYTLCVRWGLDDAAGLLEAAGADTTGRATAELECALFRGNAARARVALANGADPNAAELLHRAAYHGFDEYLEALIEYGARVGDQHLFAVCDWETADNKLSGEEDHEKRYARVVELLIQHGANPRAVNHEGKTPLQAIEGDGLLLIEQVLKDALEASEPPATA